MAELVETRDLTDPSQHGWAFDYRIRRDDGEELHAEVRCWDKAHAAARQSANAEALAAIEDRGVAVALEYAEVVDPPSLRGAVLISVWFDPADEGRLTHRVSYERSRVVGQARRPGSIRSPRLVEHLDEDGTLPPSSRTVMLQAPLRNMRGAKTRRGRTSSGEAGTHRLTS
jgi:hypothetical protein